MITRLFTLWLALLLPLLICPLSLGALCCPRRYVEYYECE